MSDENKPEQPQFNGAGKLPARIATYVIVSLTVLGVIAFAAGTLLSVYGSETAAIQCVTIAAGASSALGVLLTNAK